MDNQPDLLTPNYNQQVALPNSTAALVLGILSIVGSLCYGFPGLLFGIIGLVLANKDRKLYRATPDLYSPASYSSSNSGRVCSIIGLCIGGVFTLIIIAIVVFAMIMAGSSGGFHY